ncbi:hypothetical protein [Zavarzinella formosa]|uniref:hypothetical protein n=1 Tax=Zavarzinella formosa TaxID=360055 RepID=UPI0002DF6187|nr:hypothetical protein [Zavarzinella formosa]
MPELTLETLAARLASLEQKVAALSGVIPPTRDWKSVVGISVETDFSRQMQAEMESIREAERKAAREGTGE